MRTILLIVFHRTGKGDEERAIHFVMQARDVLRTEYGKKVSPSLKDRYLCLDSHFV